MADNEATGAARPRSSGQGHSGQEHSGQEHSGQGSGDQGPSNPGPVQPRQRPVTRVTAGTPDALLALVPHLLGFYPSSSLVVLGLGGKRYQVRVTFRYDLPDPPDCEQAADIAEHAVSVLQRQRLPMAALIGYGPVQLAGPVLAAAMDSLLEGGVELMEVLRAERGRYWSVLCTDPACCPAEGRAFDPGSHPVAAAMAEAGLAALPDRAALARTLLPPAGSTEAIRRSTRLAERRLCELGETYRADGGRDRQEQTVRAGRAAVQRAIKHYRAGDSLTSGDELAWLAVLVADLRVRDDAWARMNPRYRDAHLRLWTDVLRAAATEYVPAPASLLAFTAWQSGNGALASVAVDRAVTARPGYSMALLIGEALDAGLPPSAAKLPMTPAEVAASYAARSGGARAKRSGTGQSRAKAGGRARTRAAGGQSASARPRAGT
jgi:Domain of unknown function (DUF4192)